MNKGVFCLYHFRRADPALRAALNAVRQYPIASRSAIHAHVIVVSARKRAAIRPYSRPLSTAASPAPIPSNPSPATSSCEIAVCFHFSSSDCFEKSSVPRDGPLSMMFRGLLVSVAQAALETARTPDTRWSLGRYQKPIAHRDGGSECANALGFAKSATYWRLQKCKRRVLHSKFV